MDVGRHTNGQTVIEDGGGCRPHESAGARIGEGGRRRSDNPRVPRSGQSEKEKEKKKHRRQ